MSASRPRDHLAASAGAAANAPAANVLEWRRLLGLLRFTRGMGRAYTGAYVFHTGQIVTYHLLTFSLSYLIDRLIPQKQIGPLLIYLALYSLSFAIHGWFTVRSAIYKIHIVRNLIANLREAIIKKLQVLQMYRLEGEGAGGSSMKLLQDIDRVQAFYNWLLDGFMSSVFGFLLAFPFLFYMNPWLTLVVLVYAPITPVLQKLVAKRLGGEAKRFRDETQDLSRRVVEFVSGIKHIRTSATESIHGGDVMTSVAAVRDADIRFSVIMRIWAMLMQFLGDIVPIILWVLVGCALVWGMDMPMGTAIAFVTLTTRAIGSLNAIFAAFDQIIAASPSIAAIGSIIEQSDVENDGSRDKDFTLKGGITVRDLHFSYPTRQGTEQLAGVDLELAPGERLALVGPSGSGKTTFIEVLLGLYPRKSGEVLYDGVAIDQLDLPSLRSQIAIVSQETFLFRTTIRENLRVARPGATEEEIREACRKAGILDFVDSLPEGFGTMLGERGSTLSGGQRQRFGVARAFLREAAIIILDEPSSALDTVSERAFIDMLYRHIENRTLIVVAHRLSTIRGVDRVAVFDEGKVVEMGAPQMLAAKDGRFRQLVEGNRSGFSVRLDRPSPKTTDLAPGEEGTGDGNIE